MLFEDTSNLKVCSSECCVDANISVFVSENGGDERAGKMADIGGQPTNKDSWTL